MKEFKVKEFDNDQKLVAFVNDSAIQKESIILIEKLKDHTYYRLFWFGQ